MPQTTWTPGDESASQTLTDADHLYAEHLNELRVAVNGLQASRVVTVGLAAGADYVCDGTADNVQIQAAIDSLSSTLGGEVYVLPGLYDIADSIVLTDPNVHLNGGSQGTVLRLANSVNKPVIKIEITALYSEISNFKIDGNAANNATPGGEGNPGIYFEEACDSTVRDCRIYDCFLNCISILSGSRNKILHNTLTDSDEGVRINVGDDNLVDGNTVLDNAWGITIYNNANPATPARRNKIVNNYVAGCTGTAGELGLGGIAAVGGAEYTLIDNNFVEDCYGRGIEAFNLSTGTIISNNTIKNTGLISGGAGIDLAPDDYLKVINNTIVGCGGAGIFLSGGHHCIIQGNHCINNSQNADIRATGGGCGITINYDTTCNYNLVIGNYCIDDQVSKTQDYGIREWQGAAGDYLYNSYVGNFTQGNITAGISLVSITSVQYGNLNVT
jgi:parallel beta-helix repeat protein